VGDAAWQIVENNLPGGPWMGFFNNLPVAISKLTQTRDNA